MDSTIIAALIGIAAGLIGAVAGATASYFYTRDLEKKKWERRKNEIEMEWEQRQKALQLELEMQYKKQQSEESKKIVKELTEGSHSPQQAILRAFLSGSGRELPPSLRRGGGGLPPRPDIKPKPKTNLGPKKD